MLHGAGIMTMLITFAINNQRADEKNKDLLHQFMYYYFVTSFFLPYQQACYSLLR